MTSSIARSVFRRGGQKGAETDPQAALAQKLEHLTEVWSAPKAGKEQSLAIWKSDWKLAEIVKVKGKLTTTMGFFMKKKQYLHIEEAVFLIDRGSMLMFVDTQEGSTQLVSLHEAYEIMFSSGVSVDTFLIYTQLKRNGYIARRYPTRWTLQDNESPDSVWEFWGGLSKANSMDFEDNAISNTPIDLTSFNKPPKLESQQSGEKDRVDQHREWWPPISKSHSWLAEADDMIKEIPRFEVEDEQVEGSKVPCRFGEISTKPHKCTFKPEIVFEVFNPNSQFKRRAPDPPACLICVANGPHVQLQCFKTVESRYPNIPIKYALVENSDVLFLESIKCNFTPLL